jgi:hypothetical protein
LDGRRGADVEGGARGDGGVGPGVARFAAEVEELEGALGAGAGRDVAAIVSARVLREGKKVGGKKLGGVLHVREVSRHD